MTLRPLKKKKVLKFAETHLHKIDETLKSIWVNGGKKIKTMKYSQSEHQTDENSTQSDLFIKAPAQKTTAMTCLSLSRGSNVPLLPRLIIDAVRRTADTDQSGAWHRSRLPPRLSGHLYFLCVRGWAGAAALFDSRWSSFFFLMRFFFPHLPSVSLQGATRESS